MILRSLVERRERKQKSLAVLVDPDKIHNKSTLQQVVEICNRAKVDFILVGGSLLVQHTIPETIIGIKEVSDIDVIIFPGSNLHIHNEADGVLFLSLISGRNPDLLIGQHVAAAPILKKSSLQVLPTGYILVGNDANTTVAHISQTTPIPLNKPEIAVCTAMAGELLGLQLIYLDAGSGAKFEVPPDMISMVAKSIDRPLIVGGGINSTEKLSAAFRSGADLAVIGTAIEINSTFVSEAAAVRDEMNAIRS
jgi:putative glycerol-1-phosphate prenyltransferase